MFNKLFFTGFFGSVIGLGLGLYLGLKVNHYLGRGWGIATVVLITFFAIVGLMALGKKIAIPSNFR